MMDDKSKRDCEDVTVVRKPCGCVSLICVTAYIDKETRKEIGELVVEGCTVEHMPASESRKQQFMCSHVPQQNDLFAGVTA